TQISSLSLVSLIMISFFLVITVGEAHGPLALWIILAFSNLLISSFSHSICPGGIRRAGCLIGSPLVLILILSPFAPVILSNVVAALFRNFSIRFHRS